MKNDLFEEVARKMLKENISAGRPDPLFLNVPQLHAKAKQFDSSVNDQDLRDAVTHFIQTKALTMSDGLHLGFKMTFVDNVPHSAQYPVWMNGEFALLTDASQIIPTSIMVNYPVIGSAQNEIDRSDNMNMEVYQLANIVGDRIDLAAPDFLMPKLPLTGIADNVVRSESLVQMIDSKKWWIKK